MLLGTTDFLLSIIETVNQENKMLKICHWNNFTEITGIEECKIMTLFFFFLAVLGFEFRASHLLGGHFATWDTPSTRHNCFLM
jgi:hypothetical protein